MLKKINVDFDIKNYSSDDDVFTFDGLASTFEKDLDGDIIVKGAFGDTLSQQIPILYQHNHQEPIGITTFAKEDSKGLYIQAQLPKDDTLVSGRVIPQMKIGSIKSMSIGFSINRDDIEVKGEDRYLKKINLKEISLVTFPANTGSCVNSFKSELKDVLELKNKRELEKHLRELGMSRKAALYISSKVDFDEDIDAKKSINKIDQLIRSLDNGRNKQKT